MASEVTALLKAWGGGDQHALDALVPLVHGELRRLAHCYMSGEQAGHSLQTSALVNEAYLKLVDCQHVRWQDRTHFFAVSANLMRRILVDYARSRNYLKRGAAMRPLSLNDCLDCAPGATVDLVGLDDCLNDLAAIDSRKSKAVELRFFGGLNAEEIAEILQVSPQTVLREAQRSRKSEQLTKEQLALFEAAWQAQRPESQSDEDDDDDDDYLGGAQRATSKAARPSTTSGGGHQALARHLTRERIVHDLAEAEKHCASRSRDLR